MIITCPTCTTRYYAGETSLGNRARKVRCAKCGHNWMLEPETEPVVTDAGPEEDPFARDPLTAPSAPEPRAQASAATAQLSAAEEVDIYTTPIKPRQANLDNIVSLVLAGMLFIGILAGAYQYRTDIVSAWPGFAGLYARIGIPVNVLGLEIRKTTWQIQTLNGMPMLVVKGEIANTTTRAADVPRLTMVLRDAHAHELYRWSADAGDVKRLGAGEVAPFTTTLKSPPMEAHDIEIRFLTGT